MCRFVLPVMATQVVDHKVNSTCYHLLPTYEYYFTSGIPLTKLIIRTLRPFAPVSEVAESNTPRLSAPQFYYSQPSVHLLNLTGEGR